MSVEGPPLERLTRRLADCPADFLEEPRISNTGAVHVDAVVADLIFDCTGRRPTLAQLNSFISTEAKKDRNRLKTVLLACWLLAEPTLAARDSAGAAQRVLNLDGMITYLRDDVADLAAVTTAAKLTNDTDRREEFARFTLACLGLHPQGESEAQAQDRLTTISTAERQRVIAASRAAEERARGIRDQLAKQAAQEAADKWNRE